jgi:F-actin capping protein alpha subunit
VHLFLNSINADTLNDAHRNILVANISYQQTTPASGSLSNTEDGKLSEKQKLLQTNLKSKLSDMYPSDDSAVAVFTKDGKIFVNISAEKINLRNFWSGRMFSSWTIVMSPTHFVISGDIKV